jgi:hypothetical protein
MAPIIASIVFFAGIVIAVLSALVAERNRNKAWYAPPSIYSLIVNVAYEKIYNHGFDVSATVFFAAALTLIGWGVVRFELRRDRHPPT